MQLCTICVALKRLGTQMGDAVALEVLGPGEGLPTPLLSTDKAAIIIMFPKKKNSQI